MEVSWELSETCGAKLSQLRALKELNSRERDEPEGSSCFAHLSAMAAAGRLEDLLEDRGSPCRRDHYSIRLLLTKLIEAKIEEVERACGSERARGRSSLYSYKERTKVLEASEGVEADGVRSEKGISQTQSRFVLLKSIVDLTETSARDRCRYKRARSVGHAL